MQLEFVKPDAGLAVEILAFKQAFFSAGERVINGSAGLDFYPTFAEWLAYLAAIESGEEEGFVPSLVWFARERGTRQLLGVLDIRPGLPPEKAKYGHIGYAVVPAARGQGIAGAMVAFGTQRLAQSGVREPLACCYEDNAPSRRVLEKNGFVHSGRYVEDETGFTVLQYRRMIK